MCNFFNLLVTRERLWRAGARIACHCDRFHIQEGHSLFMRTSLFCFCFVTAEVKYFAVQITLINLRLIKYKFLLFEGSFVEWVLLCVCDLGFRLDEECSRNAPDETKLKMKQINIYLVSGKQVDGYEVY